jgi:sulfonate transport system permease protein
MKFDKARFFRRCFIPALLLILWWWGSAAEWWNSYILPSPAQVWDAFVDLCRSGELAEDLWASVRRVLIGFSWSFVLAFTLGVISARSTHGDYYSHIVEFLRHVPPLSLIPLLILWFGIGEKSKTVLIVLASFFPVYLSVYKGFHGADRKLVEVGRTMGFTEWQLFCRIEFPCAVPDVLNGLRIGLGYSWRAIIGAEMIAAASGLGYLILDAQQMSRSDRVLAGVFVIGTVGWLSDLLIALAISRIAPGGVNNG